jgi:hypothetical protein
MFTRSMVTLSLFIFPLATATAQVSSSANLAWTVGASGGMACNGISSVDAGKSATDRKGPYLSVTHFIIEAGAALTGPDKSSSDVLVIGITDGELVNEKPPGGHMGLTRDSVFLLPAGESYLLRNKGSQNVELRLIEVRR